MKILIGFISGLLCAYAVIFFFPKLQQHSPQLSMLTATKAHSYSHKAEGKLLQTLEFIEGEEFKSTEGNEASLHQLANQCKLILNVFGESYQYSISFYFHQGKIQSAFETSYNYPQGGFYAEAETERAYETQQQYLKIMNPTNTATLNLFEQISSKFKPVLIKAC